MRLQFNVGTDLCRDEGARRAEMTDRILLCVCVCVKLDTLMVCGEFTYIDLSLELVLNKYNPSLK